MFTQHEAAEYLGLTDPCLSLLMTGKRSRPTVETAVAIQRGAGIPVEAWLVVDEALDREVEPTNTLVSKRA